MEEYMGYEKYRADLLGALKEKFGDMAVEVNSIRKNNDVVKEAFCICQETQNEKGMMPVYPEDCYRVYVAQGISLKQCVERIVDMHKQIKQEKLFSNMKNKLMDWESVKSDIYPMLLSTELNRKNLKGLVRKNLMDLTIIWVVRWNAGRDRSGHIKVTKQMLESYGVSVRELHKQALLNMKEDGYKFWRMEDMISGILNKQEEKQERRKPAPECRPADEPEGIKMYVLTNSLGMFGAAGILDQEFLKDKLGEKSYYMLPSSIHETIFVPALEEADRKALNCMVREVNESEVSEEERLSDHCYFYEGKTGEFKSCA